MNTLTLQSSMRALEAALTLGRRRGLAPLAVVVLDAGGHVRAAAREDGAGFAGIDIATAKARGALSLSMSSREIGELFGASPLNCATLATALGGQLLPIAGAVLIRNSSGLVLGAIAAAGDAPDNDENAAVAGRDAALAA